MRSLSHILGALFIVIVISGCSSKNYFEPNNIAGAISYDGSLASQIIDISREGAVLDKGQIISKDGQVLDLGVDNSYKFIAKTSKGFLVADGLGALFIFDGENKKKLMQFTMSVASANIKDEYLAVVLSNNQTLLIDLKTKETIHTKQHSPSYANNAKIANPYFLGSLLVFPTLDGKLDIFDIRSQSVIKTIIVSSSKLFSNVIFLDVINDYLVAASGDKVISISPNRVFQKECEVKDVVFVEDGIYILTKDGKIILCDAQLNELKSRKFQFAHFVGLIYGDFLYVVEKEGYLIALDKSLASVNVYEMPESIEEYVFTTKDTVYVGDQYFKLNSQK